VQPGGANSETFEGFGGPPPAADIEEFDGFDDDDDAAADNMYDNVGDAPKSKLKRDIGDGDEFAPMDLQPIDIEAYEMLDQNHISLDEIPPGVLARLKEFNRYKNILPNPRSRVKLPQIGDDTCSTFINANFIENWQGNAKGYIAAQGPKDTTIDSFWRMVWQEDVRTIIMTTGLMEGPKEKCARYWPAQLYNEDTNEGFIIYGDVKVGVVAGVKRDGYKVAELKVSLINDPLNVRVVKHFWFDTWPDYGVPQDGLVLPKMLAEVRGWNNVDHQPWIVHCSAGIGRTGTLVGIDIGMASLEDTNNADVVNIVEAMRDGRGGMVQTPEQYAFVHRCLEDYAIMKNRERGVSEVQAEGQNLYGNVGQDGAQLAFDMEA